MKMTATISNLLKTALLGTVLLSGCSEKSSVVDTSKDIGLVNDKLFADRYEKLTHAVVLVHLKTPSLLESSSFDENGKLVIDQEHLQYLINEQAEAVAAAKQITDEAEVLFEYKFTINAIAMSVPVEHYDAIEALGMVASVNEETSFDRPAKPLEEHEIAALINLAKEKENGKFETSVSHIQADQAHSKLGITGKGVKVGIIDTGIDYTHKMLGGSGNPQDYLSIDPTKENDMFPNAKVVGGYDFVGSDFATGPLLKKFRIPKPDKNPLDEQGHGTHVAGTVAGIGDNVNTYSGVAPDADLYALKVFGAGGGTSDTVVIAALEWAMDPNGDYDPSDRLDVLNLSLGGSFGKPKILYSLAVKNLAKSKMITAISAGNSGATPYIVGAPSTTAESMSVAASIDAMEKNWKFPSCEFNVAGEDLLVQRYEAQFSEPISETSPTGKLVYIGEASSELSEEIKAKLAGNIALIDRGTNPFLEKVQRAEAAGAIGAVVANNQAGGGFTMSGEGKTSIPAIMISMENGSTIKEALKEGSDVKITFNSDKLFGRPDLIDQITSFSSQGPRSEDGLLKPEITAPGYQILSARIAGGETGTLMSGTSMSSPHMAGVFALLKQKFPNMTTEELKAVAMNRAKFLSETDKQTYSVTRQGAGLVQVYDSVTADALATPASFSLGKFQLIKKKTVRKVLNVENFSSLPKTYTVEMKNAKHMSMRATKVTVAPGQVAQVKLYITVETDDVEQGTIFHEGLVELNDGNESIITVPVFGASDSMSKIAASDLVVSATDAEDSFDALAQVTIKNDSPNAGDVQLFNLLGEDDQKPSAGDQATYLSRSCDLQAVGYRVMSEDLIQIGVKIFNPITLWQSCELSVLFDANGDGEAEQELGGLPADYLSGLSQYVDPGYYSVLLDFPTARSLRVAYEQAIYESEGQAQVGLSYAPAIVGLATMQPYENSHVAILNVNPQLVQKGTDGRIHMRVTTFNEGGVQYEDGLGKADQWFSISPSEEEQAYRDLPAGLTVPGNDSGSVEMIKGYGQEKLMIVYPSNKQVNEDQTTLGLGLQTLDPSYE